MIRRDDYKAIKRMNRGEMSEYLHRVYMRGFKAGKESNTAPRALIIRSTFCLSARISTTWRQ